MRTAFYHLYKVLWFNLPAYLEVLPKSAEVIVVMISLEGTSMESGRALFWESENLAFCFYMLTLVLISCAPFPKSLSLSGSHFPAV